MPVDKGIDRQLQWPDAAVLVKSLCVNKPLVTANNAQLVKQKAIGAVRFGEPSIDQNAVAVLRVFKTDFAALCQPAVGVCFISQRPTEKSGDVLPFGVKPSRRRLRLSRKFVNYLSWLLDNFKLNRAVFAEQGGLVLCSLPPLE